MKYTFILNNLRAYRKQAGLRQIDVACKLGFSTTDRISRWEKGQGYPHMINLFKLAVIYRASPEQLYEELFTKISSDLYPSSTPSCQNSTLPEAQPNN